VKVFISWSGDKSRDVAIAFRDWLPLVLHSVRPFVSSKDILAGARWQAEVATELEETEFGLICVTRQNVSAPWLNFEAGALAKAVDSSRVVPLAVDLSPAEVPNPLGQFQASTLNKADVEATIRSINEASAASIANANLERTFAKWWPDLEGVLDEVKSTDYGADDEPVPPERSEREMLEEVLDSVRGLGRGASDQDNQSHPQMPQMPSLFKEIRRVAEANEATIGLISHSANRYTVRFEEKPSDALLEDLKQLELISNEEIRPVFFPPSTPDVEESTTPPA
jgi:hypothetical protein